MTVSDFRIVITPTRDHFHNRDDRSQAETLVHHMQDGLSAARLVGTASISIVRHGVEQAAAIRQVADLAERTNPDRDADWSAGVDWVIALLRERADGLEGGTR